MRSGCCAARPQTSTEGPAGLARSGGDTVMLAENDSSDSNISVQIPMKE
jgi:hypothetical protein